MANTFLNFAETTVKWVDLALAAFGLALCAFLFCAFVWSDPPAPHGGAYQLIAMMLVFPVAMSALLTWLGMQRRTSWRWWGQLFPIAVCIGVDVLLDSPLVNSLESYLLVIVLPLLLMFSLVTTQITTREAR